LYAPPSELRFENTGEIHCSSLSAANWPEFIHTKTSRPGISLNRPPEKEEIRLWAAGIVVLVLLAIGFAGAAWERLQEPSLPSWPVALGLVAVAVLFAVYVYGRRRQVSELRNLLDVWKSAAARRPSRRATGPTQPGAGPLQRSFKELIDGSMRSLSQLLWTGTLRTVNRRVTQFARAFHIPRSSATKPMNSSSNPHSANPGVVGEISGATALVGRRTGPAEEQLASALFRVRLNAIVNDDQVRRASALARDVHRRT